MRVRLWAGPARRGSGLVDALYGDEGAAVAVMGRGQGLVHVQNRRDTGIQSIEEGGPLVARFGADTHRHCGLLGGPVGDIHLDGEQRIIRQAKAVQHQGIELGFDGPDGDVFAVGCLVDIIEGGGSVEDVAAAFVVPEAAGAETPHHGR